MTSSAFKASKVFKTVASTCDLVVVTINLLVGGLEGVKPPTPSPTRPQSVRPKIILITLTQTVIICVTHPDRHYHRYSCNKVDVSPLPLLFH